MKTILIIIGFITALYAVFHFLIKKTSEENESDSKNFGNGDIITWDSSDDKVTDIKKEVKVKKEIKEVSSSIKGKPTKSKLNSLTKQQLVDAVKQDHNLDLDISVKKSTLVNKVYSIYNKK